MSTRDTFQDIEHLRDRVRLYLQVMLVIDLGCEGIGIAVALLFPELEPRAEQFPPYFFVLHWGTVALLAGGWAIAKFARPGRDMLVTIESAVTILLAVLYVYLTSLLPVYGPVFALLCTLLALVVRASLVPSSVERTVLIGLACVGSVAWLGVPILSETEQPISLWLSVIGGMFVLATAVTSRVIYGLRRQVQAAMRLGQYELGRKLGEGAMGVVYEATHVMLRRPTAVKLLRPERAGERTVARFEREVQQTSRLEHPNSVSIYDYGRTPDGRFYYAMEYLDGLTLEQVIEQDGPMPSARAAAILRQAAEALSEAHAKGLVHRDIKPANIMLCERAQVPDTVKVLDFGLVKAVGEGVRQGQQITLENSLVGTPQYLAPETITDPLAVGPPADVYAMGAVGFYLVSGRHVFSGTSVADVCAKHVSKPPEAPSAVSVAPVDHGLESLILRCLAKEPDARPRDGGALVEELERLELCGWSLADARHWWSVHARPRSVTEGARAPAPLTVDVAGRTTTSERSRQEVSSLRSHAQRRRSDAANVRAR